MRRVLVIALTAGCSFSAPADVTPDASPVLDTALDTAPADSSDPTVPSVIDRQIPFRIAALDTVPIILTIQGPANALIPWTITSGGGSFDKLAGMVATNGSGVGSLAVMYTAPSTAGDRAHPLMIGSVTEAFTTPVRTLTPVGESTPFTSAGGQTIASGFFYAQRVRFPAATVVMRLALVVDDAGPNARMALYSDVAAAPGALLATTSPRSLGSGVNQLALIAPLEIAAGDYWIVANFETQASVRLDNTRTARQGFQPLAYVAAFPSSAASSVLDDTVLNYYALVAN